MKNEIVTRKVIERGKDWLRIGKTIFQLKVKEEKEEDSYEENVIYLESLNAEIQPETFIYCFNVENFKNDISKIRKLKIKEVVQEMLKSKIDLLPLPALEKEKFSQIIYFPKQGPRIFREFSENKVFIVYPICFALEKWNKPYTYLKLAEKIIKEIKISYPHKWTTDGKCNNRVFDNDIEIVIYFEPEFLHNKTMEELDNMIWDFIFKAYKKIEKEYNGGGQMKFFIDDPDLKFAMKQYLIGFPEFIRKITGKIIQFEIETDSDGLRFKIGKAEKSEDVKEELSKYMSFLSNEDSINFELLNNLGLTPIQLIRVKAFVDTQVMNFRHQISLNSEREKNKYLLKTSERIEKLFEKHIESNKINTVNISANNQLENKNNIEIDIQFNENIEKLQESVFEMKNLLNPLINDLLKKELQEIDNDLMEINNSQEFNKNKGIIGKLKRFVNGIKNISGTVILAGQAINASGETIQSLFKLKDIILNMISELGK